MPSIRIFALCSSLLLACGQGSDPRPKPDAKGESATRKALVFPSRDPKAIKAPPDDPHQVAAMKGDEPPPLPPSAAGFFDVTIEGKLTHYTRMPRGQNRAVSLLDKGINRVTVAASETDAGLPHFRLTFERLRPDQATFPLTIPGTPSKDESAPAPASVRYQVGEKRIYTTNPDKDATVTVTLTAYEGETLKGSFEGKLAPTMAGLGEAITVSGTFAVELGRRGVEPGPTTAAGDAKAEGADGKPSDGKSPDGKPSQAGRAK